MHNPWFRFYCEFAADPVVQSLSFEDQRHFVVLMCLKASGILDRPVAPAVRTRLILRGLGLGQDAGEKLKATLLSVKLIRKNWQISAWDRRQYASDSSTDRVRKYRKTHETGNVPGTPAERFGNGPEQNRTEHRKKNPPTEGKKKDSAAPTSIRPDFRPQGAGAALLDGLTQDEQRDVVREFVGYWTTCGAKRKNWQLVWLRSSVVKGNVHKLKTKQRNGNGKHEFNPEHELECIRKRERERGKAERTVTGETVRSIGEIVGTDAGRLR